MQDPMTFAGRLRREGELCGTAFVVDPSGLLVTCLHVLCGPGQREPEPDSEFVFEPFNGSGPIRVVSTSYLNELHDVALLKALEPLPAGLGAAPLASGNEIAPNARFEVVSAGVPDDLGHTYDYLSLTGRIEGLTSRDGVEVLRATATGVLPGSSGAPVFIREVGVIGVITGRYNIEAGDLTWMERTVWMAPSDVLSQLAPENLAIRHVRLGRESPRFIGGAGPAGSGLGIRSFVGRSAELESLHEKAQASPASRMSGTQVVVSGMAGVGKTFMLHAYVDLYARHYPGGIYWLQGTDDADGPVDRDQQLSQQLLTIADQSGIRTTGRKNADIGNLREAIRRSMEADGRPCLWVVDALPTDLTPTQLADWLAPSSLAVTIAATRRRDYDELTAPLHVGGLSDEDALSLLARYCGPVNKRERETARRVLAKLGHHALAVAVSGPLIARLRGPDRFASFLERLERAERDVLDEDVKRIGPMLPTGHERSIATTLQQSLLSLGDEETEGAFNPAIDTLRIASVVANYPILAASLEMILITADELEETEAASRVALALDNLSRGSLIQNLNDGTGGFVVHPLVARTFRHHDDRPARAAALKAATVSYMRAVFSRAQDPEAWGVLSVLLPHALELTRYVDNPGELTNLTDATELLGLRTRLQIFAAARGEFRVAVALGRSLTDAYAQVLGQDHPDTLSSMNNLANALNAMGHTDKAGGLLEQVLAVRQAQLGPEDPETLDSMYNVGLHRYLTDDLTGARELLEKALALNRSSLGDRHPNTLMSMSALAVVMGDLGDLNASRRLLEDVLPLQEELLGDRHPDTLATMSNLGRALFKLGDLKAARTVQRRAAELLSEVLGNHHPDTLAAMDGFADTLYSLKDLRASRALSEHVLSARRNALGSMHPDTLRAAVGLMRTCAAQGDAARTRQLLEEFGGNLGGRSRG